MRIKMFPGRIASKPAKPTGVLLWQLMVVVLTGLVSLSPTAAHEIIDKPGLPAEADQNDIRSLMQQWRSSGDDSYLDAARSAAEAAVARYPRDLSAMLDMAIVAQAQHEFGTAENLTREVLSIDARNDQARLLLASVHLVRGEAEASLRQCSALVQSPIPVIAACRARVAHALEQPEPSLTRLERLIAAADRIGTDDQLQAWMLSVAGDLAVVAGRPNDALASFRQSLGLVEATQVRAAMADVLLEAGRFEEAVAAIDSGTRSLALSVRRLIALQRLGRDKEIVTAVRRADHRFRHWIEKEDWVHAREMARFYLDVLPHPELARNLAMINIGIQSETEDRQLVSRTSGLP